MSKIQAAELRYTQGRSNKFWRYYSIDNIHWVAHWGRIGTVGQFKVMLQSQTRLLDKYQEKLAEGYTVSISFTFEVTSREVTEFKQSLNLPYLAAKFAKCNPQSAMYKMPTVPVPKKALVASLDKLLELNQ